MKSQSSDRKQQTDFTRLDRLVLHPRCLVRDHNIAGTWQASGERSLFINGLAADVKGRIPTALARFRFPHVSG
jgi:hypothetical protein